MMIDASLTACHDKFQVVYMMIDASLTACHVKFFVVYMMLPSASLTANHYMCQTLMTFAIYSLEFRGRSVPPASLSRPSASTTHRPQASSPTSTGSRSVLSSLRMPWTTPSSTVPNEDGQPLCAEQFELPWTSPSWST